MSDLLDERIRAFVAELVDDPPAIPSFPDTRVATTPRRRVSGPAITVAVFVVVLILGALVVALRPAETPEDVVTQPPTTFLGVPLEPTVPFRAQVRYEMRSAERRGVTFPVSVGVSYLGPGVFRVDVESVDQLAAGVGRLAGRTGVGSYLVTDGASAASYLAAKDLFLRFPAGETAILDLGEFGWRYWADRCREVDHEIVEETTVLSRPALHVRCREPLGDTEVWVDIETGVVLSARPMGAVVGLSIADEFGIFANAYMSWTEEMFTNGLEAVEFDLGVAPGADLFAVSAPTGAEEHPAEQRIRRMVAASVQCNVSCAEAELAASVNYGLVGSTAPPLTGVLLDGTSFDLATLQGERVAILWWSSWCPYSHGPLVAFDRAAEERTDVSFVGALMQDRPVAAESFASRLGVSIPTVDAGDRGVTDWRIDGCPTTVLLEEDGTVTAGVKGAWPAEGLAGLFRQVGW